MRAAALAAVTVAVALCATPVATARWSSPEPLSGCAIAFSSQQSPLIVFPSSEPQSRSGPGALLWLAPRECHSGAAGAEAFGATLSTDDLPGGGHPLADGVSGLAGIGAATGTAAGQVVVAGSGAGGGTMAEGRTPGAFTSSPLGGPATPVAASSSYLGDTVLASPVWIHGAGWAIAVRVQRHYSFSLAPPRLLPTGSAPVSAVAATMDYRADILIAWVSAGGVYAREIPAAGPIGSARRLGSAGAEPEIGALISDDGHAIVAWSSQSSALGGRPLTAIKLSLCEVSSHAAPSSRPASSSRPVLSSRAALIVERFRDLPGFPPPAGSLRLIRLASEAVMMGWTGMSAGRYVVRVSPVSLRRGAWAPVTISGAPKGQDAMLADLVAAPDAEALALWSAAPRTARGAPNPRRRAVRAARGHYAGAGEVSFAAPETVAPPGRNGTPAAAFDQSGGQALAAWVTTLGAGDGAGAGEGRVAYAVRATGSALAPTPARVRPPAGEVSGMGRLPLVTIALAVFVLLLAVLAAVFLCVVVRRPRRVRARRS